MTHRVINEVITVMEMGKMEEPPLKELAHQIFFLAIDSTVTVVVINLSGVNDMLLKRQRETMQVVNGILDFDAHQKRKPK